MKPALPPTPHGPATRYRTLAQDLIALIRDGVLRPGDRVPSIRNAARQNRVNPLTVMQAWQLVESEGWIEVRPRSGYYVRARALPLMPEPEPSRPAPHLAELEVSDFVFGILDASRNPAVVPLGSAFPSPLLFPLDMLARSLAASSRRMDPWSTVTDLPPGNDELRRQIALRYLASGVALPTREIVVTSGALEALVLCLQAVTRPGDLVAIESPTFYAALQTIERLRLKAIEIPTHPRDGIDLAALSQALHQHPVKACWLMPNFQNPLGSRMPDPRKRELVALLASHQVPLIEDDVYGELYFGARPACSKAFDADGMVLHCSSFSKCLAPGYRVGWVAAGRYAQAVQRLKFTSTLSASIPAQLALADYLNRGGYDAHLRRLRRTLATNQAAMRAAIAAHFPAGTRITRPDGGYFLWVELPPGADAVALHRQALEHGISIAPGPIFSPQRAFGNFIRLNYGHAVTVRVEAALATLGKLAAAQMRNAPARPARNRT